MFFLSGLQGADRGCENNAAQPVLTGLLKVRSVLIAAKGNAGRCKLAFRARNFSSTLFR